MEKNIFKNKKGVLAQFLAIALLIIIVGIFAIIFRSLSDAVFTKAQENASFVQIFNNSQSYAINVSTNFGTAGTLMGVVILLTVVAIVFTVFRNQFGQQTS